MPHPVVWIYRIVRLVLAGIFLYSGTVKLLNIPDFAYIIYEYHLVPKDLIFATAWSIASVEVLAGLALAVDMRGALAVITGLLLLFVGVLWYGILSGLEVDCGCFGPEELELHNSLRHALYRDLAMLAGVAFLYAVRRLRKDIRLLPGPLGLWRRRSSQSSLIARSSS